MKGRLKVTAAERQNKAEYKRYNRAQLFYM